MENTSQESKGRAFRELHQSGTFIMPNAWDAGSARVLSSGGFKAIATTSAGIAFSAGLPDHQKMSRDEMLSYVKRIALSIELPLSADLESGYGESPETVAETIRLAIEIGAIGCNIEDNTGVDAAPLYDTTLAANRIRAARKEADKNNIPFTLTARTDAFLTRHADAFSESVKRANLYREAGADCLFVPGVGDADTIAKLVREINGPINVVMGLTGNSLTFSQLKDMGVRRISIGGSLARASFGLIQRAAFEMKEKGSFAFSNDQYPHAALCEFFAKFDESG